LYDFPFCNLHPLVSPASLASGDSSQITVQDRELVSFGIAFVYLDGSSRSSTRWSLMIIVGAACDQQAAGTSREIDAFEFFWVLRDQAVIFS